MYCDKCKYTSFDHLPSCPKCGFDWKEDRTALQLFWLQSSGHDWFKHAQEHGESFPEEAAAGGEPEFDLAAGDDAADVSPLDGTRIADDLEFPLDQELSLDGLTGDHFKEDHAFPEGPVSADQPQAGDDLELPGAFLPEEGTDPEPVMEVSLEQEPVLEVSAEVDGTSAEDVLAAWEIPDNMIPGDVDGDIPFPALDAVDMEAPGAKKSAGPEGDIEADIVYDFSAVEAQIQGPLESEAAPVDQGDGTGNDQSVPPGPGERQ